jgi:hypothetical protein
MMKFVEGKVLNVEELTVREKENRGLGPRIVDL